MSDEVLRDFLSAHSLAHLAPALLDEELTVRLLRTMSNVSSCLAEIGIGEADAQALARALVAPASASSSTAATDEACYYRVAPGPGSRIVAPPAPLPAGSRRLALDEDFSGLKRVHASPPVYLVEGFLPAAECAALTRTCVPLLLRSRTDGGVSAGRTSDSIFLTSGCADACAPSLLARVRRLFRGLPRSRMEEPQLARYGAGQRYTEHYDTPTAGPELEQAGHAAGPGLRLATVLVYLTSLASGGETDFPRLGLRVRPRRGCALVFFPASEDGLPCPDSLHAALPVPSGEGEKWICTVWVRQREDDERASDGATGGAAGAVGSLGQALLAGLNTGG